MSSQAHFALTPNGELLRYPTLAIAKAMWIDQAVIFTSPAQMVERLTFDQMSYLHGRVLHDHHAKFPQHIKSKETAAEYLFPLLCTLASPHNPFSKGKGRKKEGTVYDEESLVPTKEKVKLNDMRLHFAAVSIFDKNAGKIAKQAYVLGRYLSQRCPQEGYTWDGVQMDVHRAHDENVLRTRQSALRIFKYYIDDLMTYGLLSFTTKDGRPCDRPRNTKKESVVVRHPLTKVKGSLTD